MRHISIVGIILIFFMFLGFDYWKKSEKIVMKIITPTVFEIDLNNNQIYDDGELICLPEITSFSTQLTGKDLAEKLHISFKDSIALGYMAEEYSERILNGEKVKLKFTGEKTSDCRYANVYTNNADFSKKLTDEGFGIINSEIANKEKFNEKLKIAQKLNLTILNHNSNKYHTLDCQYGQIARDTIILKKTQLPVDSIPCKFCHISKEKIYKKVETYPLIISNGSIKLLLTDFTLKLKPDSKCDSNVCREFVSLINAANKSVDMALFGYDNIPEVKTALINAMDRGVYIRLVYDENNDKIKYYEHTEDLAKTVNESRNDKSLNVKETNMLMHNKFIVFDNQKVLTGSMNFSRTGLSGFNSNSMLLINSKEIAQKYTDEFEQMFSRKFHNNKISVPNNKFKIGETYVSIFFSPQDKIINTQIIPLIDNAQKYIYIPAFIITHKELSEALINAKDRGIDVKIIIDATNPDGRGSQIKNLRQNKIMVKTENYAGKMHSKTIIIDDKYLITGSMNFSNSGENKNDENVVILEDIRLANYYKGYFEYIWKKIPDKYLKQNVRAESIYSIGSCSDGIDNNFDGKIDKDDPGCQK